MEALQSPTPLDKLFVVVVWIGLIGCVLASAPLNGVSDVEAFDYPKELVLGVSALLASLSWLGRRDHAVAIGWSDICWLLFVAWGGLSAATVATNQWWAWRSVALTGFGLLLMWSARRLARAGARDWLLAAACSAVGVLALVVLLEAYGVIARQSLFGRAPGGSMGVRTYAAHAMILGVPLLVGQLGTARRVSTRTLIGGILLATTMALVLTRSRAAWLAAALAAALALLRFVRRPSPAGRMLPIGIVVACGMAAAVLLPNRLVWSSVQPYRDTLLGIGDYHQGSGRGRLLQYGNTLAIVRDHPILGVGPGNWTVVYAAYAGSADPSNRPGQIWQTPARSTNDWLGIAAERGLPGLVLLLLALAATARAAWRSFGEANGFVLPITLVILMVVGTFDGVLQLPFPVFWLFTLFGTLMPDERPVATATLGITTRAVLLAGIFACALPILRITLDQVCAQPMLASETGVDDLERVSPLLPENPRFHAYAAIRWEHAGHCDRALEHCEVALRLSPWNALCAAIVDRCRAEGS